MTIPWETRKKELLTLINTILEQNYLQFNNQFFKQKEGIAMRASTSGILAEILVFIQYFEHTTIRKIKINTKFYIIIDTLTIYNLFTIHTSLIYSYKPL
jgi:hypothetical protein